MHTRVQMFGAAAIIVIGAAGPGDTRDTRPIKRHQRCRHTKSPGRYRGFKFETIRDRYRNFVRRP